MITLVPNVVVWSTEDRSYGWHVALAARDHLEAKAARLEVRAGELRALAVSEAIRVELATGIAPGPELVERAGLWHEQRATGARERAERVDQCQKSKIFTVSCTGCGSVHERPARCDCGLLCASCRGSRKQELQKEFTRARAIVMGRALSLGLLRRSLPGGAYGEKFLTLTVPHSADHDVGERIRIAFEAWRRFAPMLSAFMREHERQHFHGEPIRRWWHFRRFEWTPGADGLGHPHFHLWLLAPYLPQQRFREMWRTALARVKGPDGTGRAFEPGELDEILLPDVRQVVGDVSRELIKYITKDWHEGKRLAPHVYAEVFKELDGKRLTQASRGFMGLAEQIRRCPDCHEHHPAMVELRHAKPGELDQMRVERRAARGPPPPAGVPGELASGAA